MAPRFEVDPLWPKPLPNHWILGQTIGVSVDAKDHVWIIHRAGSLEAGEMHATTNPQTAQCCAPAPPVLEFDQARQSDRPLGRAGRRATIGRIRTTASPSITKATFGSAATVAGRERSGAIGGKQEEAFADKGIGGVQSFNDNMVLKFTQDGKFLMQIGKPGQSKGSNDIENLRLPAKTFVDPKTNELYVADGYGNHRVIVFDADTGKYKRHWGAYGHKPDDADHGPYNPNDPPPQQFRNPVHCAELSNDGLLYVCDRVNDRIQVFKPDGTFVKEMFIKKTRWDPARCGTSRSRRIRNRSTFIWPMARTSRCTSSIATSLEVLTSFGEGGRQPGEFYGVHSIATDSKGNIYTTETYRGQRVQKFVYKGLAPVTKKDQGVVWPKKVGMPTWKLNVRNS